MEKVDPVEIINSFLDIRQKVQMRTKEVRQIVEYREKEFNDITHALEFNDFNAVMLCKLTKELQVSKRTRRRCKNDNELLTPLYDYFGKNYKFFDGLMPVLKEIESKLKEHENRCYKVRVREDLSQYLEKVQTK